jgi:hypothetical protein
MAEGNRKTIGEHEYSFGTLPAIEAVRVEVAIGRVIGEPLFKAFMDHKKTGQEEDDMRQAGAAAIGLMTSKMDTDELIQTMESVLKYVTCDGKRLDINAHFTGRNKELWQVFIAALQHNFSDFLPESLFASVRDKLKA